MVCTVGPVSRLSKRLKSSDPTAYGHSIFTCVPEEGIWATGVSTCSCGEIGDDRFQLKGSMVVNRLGLDYGMGLDNSSVVHSRCNVNWGKRVDGDLELRVGQRASF